MPAAGSDQIQLALIGCGGRGDSGIQSIRAYRMGPSGPLRPKPEDKSDLEWPLRNFTKFYWVSGGLWSEMDIHQIDEICPLMGDFPVGAHGVGGRGFDNTTRGQNLDSYSVEWTFPNGSKAYHVVRYIPKCHNESPISETETDRIHSGSLSPSP